MISDFPDSNGIYKVQEVSKNFGDMIIVLETYDCKKVD